MIKIISIKVSEENQQSTLQNGNKLPEKNLKYYVTKYFLRSQNSEGLAYSNEKTVSNSLPSAPYEN